MCWPITIFLVALLCTKHSTIANYLILRFFFFLQNRIGATTPTILGALARAVEIERCTSKCITNEQLRNASDICINCYSMVSDLSYIIPILLEQGVEGLEKSCQIAPGIPISPMLAKISNNLADVMCFSLYNFSPLFIIFFGGRSKLMNGCFLYLNHL